MGARKWGKIETIFGPYENVAFATDWARERIVDRMEKVNFSSGDFLLLAGDPVVIGIAFAAAAARNRGIVNCLKWDKQERSYYEVAVNMGGES
ncbi:MAG: hypothetical protein P8N94_15635 [Gammaproteobacteria bacterium]|nr:hypothetical protein [Gammaproteobacteria bacterium]